GASGATGMASALILGTGLAVLSKGNGILLPLLAWVLEATVFKRLDAGLPIPASQRLRLLRVVLLVLPTTLVFLMLASYLPNLGAPAPARGFSAAQRLLTEPRVLLDYLRLLYIPRATSSGLFNDAYVVSTGWATPRSTLPALLAIAALLAAGLGLRRRAPVWSAALLFFFAGHLLESTVINLELYFEHRNYLPAMLLFWPPALALCEWRRPFALRLTIALSLLALFAFTTFERASLWGQPEKLAALWAMQESRSPRAQAAAAIAESAAGRPAEAVRRLDPLWRRSPHDLQLAFNYVDARCASSGLDANDKARVAAALRHTPRSELLTNRWLDAAIDSSATGECPGLTPTDVRAWVEAALQNPAIATPAVRLQDIEPLLGHLDLVEGHPAQALAHFDRALRAIPSPDTAARQASVLASAEAYEQALAHLDLYESLRASRRAPGPGMPWLHRKVMDLQGYWPREMAVLRRRLHAAIAERDAGR
ncbi:MAG: tetratricopeptide repeat protein, partial [Arenimonas sp.]